MFDKSFDVGKSMKKKYGKKILDKCWQRFC